MAFVVDRGAFRATTAPIRIAADRAVRVDWCGLAALAFAPLLIRKGPGPPTALAAAAQIGVAVTTAMPWITVAWTDERSGPL
ncbi:hypothetical protein MMON_38530 [Mycolicibacterium monacense]|uniref:Uncharacterized protein n=1 Tax=Mycolicibacterium monacense TaxID=85693 RepID=A0AAD1IZJ9_MYCMB|nr:hypothetical protein MMON_38530 [Mycolicibacterium monacense]